MTGLYLGLGGPNIDSNMFVEAVVYPPGKPIYLAEDFFIHLPLFEMRATLVGWLRFTVSVHYLSTRTPREKQRYLSRGMGVDTCRITSGGGGLKAKGIQNLK